jgi:RND family efflux transporter MFP subunit
VTARDTDVGALINVGGGSAAELFVVSDIRKLRVYVQVPQSYGPAIRPGSRAALQVPEYPGHDFDAQVVALANAVNASSGTTLVQLMVDNTDGKLMPGSFVHVRFPLPSDAAALRIPADTLIFDNNGLRVATVGSDDKITFKTISIRHDYGKTVEIGSGLSVNDRVISSPPDGINDGDTVKIASSEATTKPNKDSGVKVAKAS